MELTGGDPFARNDIWEILTYADKKRIIMYINSDLSILKTTDLERLQAIQHLAAIQTSLDGATPEVADASRGRGAWQITVKQLGLLSSLGIPIGVGTTVHKGNFNTVREIAELVSQFDGQYYVGPMYPVGRGSRLWHLVLSPDEWDCAVRQFVEAVRIGLVMPADALWHKLIDVVPASNPVRDQVYITNKADRTLRIDPTGAVYVSAKLRHWCPRFHTVGHVTTTSLQQIWEGSEQLQELRSLASPSNPFRGIDIREIPGALVRTEVIPTLSRL